MTVPFKNQRHITASVVGAASDEPLTRFADETDNVATGAMTVMRLLAEEERRKHAGEAPLLIFRDRSALFELAGHVPRQTRTKGAEHRVAGRRQSSALTEAPRATPAAPSRPEVRTTRPPGGCLVRRGSHRPVVGRDSGRTALTVRRFASPNPDAGSPH